MSSRIKFINLLTAAGLNPYEDFVPQNQPLPAVSYTFISAPHSRELNGARTGSYCVWRLQLVAKTKADLETLENTVQTLDNVSNVDFRRVLVDPLEPVAQDSESITYVTTVDIRTYER